MAKKRKLKLVIDNVYNNNLYKLLYFVKMESYLFSLVVVGKPRQVRGYLLWKELEMQVGIPNLGS